MSFFLRFLLRYLEPHSIIAARRKNWDFLNEYIRGIQNIRPLFEDLSCEAIPYVLPIVAEKGDALSSKLRGAGINILRFGEYLWEEREKIGCPVSKKLSESCIQLPIHQSISEADLEYMATQLAT
jgi:dTDP-4-amino-4,6-dideoxygalactose transaminase